MHYRLAGCRFCFSTLIRMALSLALVLFVFSGLAHGQGLGSFGGTITDSSGAVVPSATVTVNDAGRGFTRSVTAGGDGHYVIPNLPPSGYSLTVDAPGFQHFSQTGLTLQADESATINVKLEVGAATQSVTVQATAVQVDSTTETLKEVVDNSRMNEMPLNGRNAAALMSLVAGAVTADPSQADQGKTKTFPVAVTISTNGTRENMVSFRLDGAENIDNLSNVNAPFPAPDALQEFSVQTSNYSAEFGQNAGGVVNVITKSGTNQFHGDAYGFVRNGDLNARNFFAAQTDPLKRSQFGATLGGPIIKNKTFFFVEYQGTRISSNFGGQSAFVPSPANLVGNFSAYLSAGNPGNPVGKAVVIKDPLTGLPFPNNQIPLNRLDPASLKVAALLPQAGGNGSVFYSKPDVENFDETMVRVDHTISNSDRVFVRYFWDRYDFLPVLANNNILTYATGSHIPFQSTVLRETHIFQSNLLNDARLSYVREGDIRLPPANAPSWPSLGVNGIWNPPLKAIESIAATGYFSFGDSSQANIPRQEFAGSDDLRWVKGRNNFSFGGSFERDRFDADTIFQENPSFTFSGDSTGNGLADFMLGSIRTYTQSNGLRLRLRGDLIGLYAQDSIHATSRLTLNLGIRWDPSAPWHDLYGQQDVFSISAFLAGQKSPLFTNAPPGLFFEGDSQVPRDGERGAWKNFAPRVGFAYDVFGDGKTSIRGGGGIFYDSRFPGYYNYHEVNTPYSVSITLTSPKGPFSNPLLGIPNPFPLPNIPTANVPFPSPVTVVSWDPSGQYTTPTIYQWNLTLEHQLAQNWLVRAAYVGTRSTHLSEDVQLNPAVYIPGSALSVNQRRLYQGYASVQQASNSGNGWYNGLQLTLNKRFSHGLTILANYTYSKSQDNQCVDKNAGSIGLSCYNVEPYYYPNSQSLSYGPSDFDRTQNFVVSAVWQLPVRRGASAWERRLLGNWEIGGIGTALSGDPLTIVAGLDESHTGLGLDRGVYLGGPTTVSASACQNVAPCVNWVNPNAFALPAIGTFGNAGKGDLRGPGLLNFDMNFSKSISITERFKLQIRAEFFNIFNHANFLDPGSASSTKGSSDLYTAANSVSLSAAGFGTIRAALDPRITQLALKLVF